MSITIAGIVKNGVVVPNAPLPEGAWVEIRLNDNDPAIAPEFQEELRAWQQASAKALDVVERLAREIEAHEKG